MKFVLVCNILALFFLKEMGCVRYACLFSLLKLCRFLWKVMADATTDKLHDMPVWAVMEFVGSVKRIFVKPVEQYC